ncbi:adhesion G-protein coupled receptor G2 [Sarotherodon galilaeus]
MILLLFLFGLALGAPSESPSRPQPPEEEVQSALAFYVQGEMQGTPWTDRHCPPFWYSFNGRCYKYVATHMSWADADWANAELYCLSQGANLVSIHNTEEENFVRSLIGNSDPTQAPTWIGLKGRWMWSDGSVVGFVNWNAGEPNNVAGKEHCATNNFSSPKKWNDYPCSHSFSSKWNDHKCSLNLASVCATRITCP